MRLFWKKQAIEEPAAVEEYSPWLAIKPLVLALNWTVESVCQTECVLLVPKIDRVKLRCILTVTDMCVDISTDAGIRMCKQELRASLAWKLLEAYCISAGKHEAKVTMGGLFDPQYFGTDDLKTIVEYQAARFHMFIHDMLDRGLLFYPTDFLGYQSHVIAMHHRI
jgi:hypothetical protein